MYKSNLKIKQANMHHSNQLLNIKNHYNHILESMLSLFNSTSSFLLKEMFEK